LDTNLIGRAFLEFSNLTVDLGGHYGVYVCELKRVQAKRHEYRTRRVGIADKKGAKAGVSCKSERQQLEMAFC
jgi:hypothetical protein